MSELSEYLELSRERGVPPETSVQLLLAVGWSPDELSQALLGRDAPRPGGQHRTTPHVSAPNLEALSAMAPEARTGHDPDPTRQSLSPAMAAMHHVFLWFFVGSFTFGISAAVSVILNTSAAPTDLNNFIAVIAISLSVYLGFYVVYLRKALRPPYLSAHPVWTTITVCLLGVASMTAAIFLIVNLLDAERGDLVVTSAIVLVLYLALLLNYVAATFFSVEKRMRKRILVTAVPVVTIVLVVLFAASIANLGPIQRDESTREDLVSAGEMVASSTAKQGQLPKDDSELKLPAGVSYSKKDEVTYELCASFERDAADYVFTNMGDQPTDTYQPNDSYLSTTDFYASAGSACFTVVSDELTNDESGG